MFFLDPFPSSLYLFPWKYSAWLFFLSISLRLVFKRCMGLEHVKPLVKACHGLLLTFLLAQLNSLIHSSTFYFPNALFSLLLKKNNRNVLVLRQKTFSSTSLVGQTLPVGHHQVRTHCSVSFYFKLSVSQFTEGVHSFCDEK